MRFTEFGSQHWKMYKIKHVTFIIRQFEREWYFKFLFSALTTRIDVDDTVLKLAITRKIVVDVFSVLESRGYSLALSLSPFFFFF